NRYGIHGPDGGASSFRPPRLPDERNDGCKEHNRPADTEQNGVQHPVHRIRRFVKFLTYLRVGEVPVSHDEPAHHHIKPEQQIHNHFSSYLPPASTGTNRAQPQPSSCIVTKEKPCIHSRWARLR